jgi:CRP/FNR family transcriptional regulator, cyclic AMP receptor protein
MSMKEEVEILRNIPLFSKLEPAKLKLLAFTSERLTFEPGQAFFQQGDPGDAAYIVMDGSADVLIQTPKGPVKVANLGRNAIVGEIAILCDVPRTATVVAQQQTVTLKINKETFFRLVAEFPQMAVEIMRELARRLEKTNEQLRDTIAKLRSA